MATVPIKILGSKDSPEFYPLTALEAVRLPDDFTVTGVTVGNLKDGTTISAGSSMLEILTQMLKQRIQPTATAPSISISGGRNDVEVGTDISNSTISMSYTDGRFTLNGAVTQAGCNVTNCKLTQLINGSSSVVYNGSSMTNSYRVPASTYVREGNANVRYSLSVSYSANTVTPKDNFGDDSTVTIAAESRSASTQWNGKYRCYVGYDQGDSIVTTASVVKTIHNSGNSLMPNTNNATSSWSIVTNNARRIMIAYPSNMKDISQIELTTEPGSHYEVNFTKNLVQVGGVANRYPREFKVYTWLLSAPSSGDTFNVTL